MGNFLFALFLAVSFSTVFAASGTVTVSGGITVNGEARPALFTWNSALPLSGSGWAAGESISIALRGPLNTPGVGATDLVLGSAAADAQGNLSATPSIPYDRGV